MYNKLKQEREEEKFYQHDEIDLHYVFDKIGRGFNSLFDKIRYVFLIARRRALLILLFMLIGFGTGYLFFKMTKPYYISSMTLVLADIRNEFIEGQLDNLSIMIKEDNFAVVAGRLNIEPNVAAQIKQMSFNNLDADRIAEDSILTGSPFQIELSLYDNNLFETLEPAIVNYLENNQYFSKQKRIRQREIESMLVKLKQEIKSIDSVKTGVASPRGPVNGFVYGQPIDPTTLYRESLSMYERQVGLEAELDLLDNIQVVNGFTPRAMPTGPNLLKFLVIGGAVAFLTGLLLALQLEAGKSSTF